MVMQVEVLRAVLHFGQFDYIDHLLLNVTTCTGCGQFQCEKITPIISDLCTTQQIKLAVKALDPWLFAVQISE